MNTIRKTALALAMTAVLGGCGGDAEPAGASAPSSSTSAAPVHVKKRRFESVKADCMKQKGFKYIAYVPQEDPITEDERKRRAGDYEALKAQRAKYGFGIFAIHVHPAGPDSPEVMPDLSKVDPNAKIRAKLSPVQRDRYYEVMNDCIVVAAERALGKKVTSERDMFKQASDASDRAVERAIDGDAELIKLASSMATCLRGRGYKVTSTKPSKLPQRGRIAFLEEQDRIGRKQRGEVPDEPSPTKEGETERYYGATLTPAEAKPYLEREIKAALDDLECGRDFYRVYTPKVEAISQRVWAEWGG